MHAATLLVGRRNPAPAHAPARLDNRQVGRCFDSALGSRYASTMPKSTYTATESARRARTRRPKPAPPAEHAPPIIDRLLTTKEVAAVLGVTPRTIRRWMLERIVPFVRLGPGTVRFQQKALERFIAKREQRAL